MMTSKVTEARKNTFGSRAKSPCHNCSDWKLDCDKQRPRCYTCIQRLTLCRGYKLDLNWQSGVASRGNLVGFNYPATPVATPSSSKTRSKSSKGKNDSTNEDRQFKFVVGKPTKRRRVATPGQIIFESCSSRPDPPLVGEDNSCISPISIPLPRVWQDPVRLEAAGDFAEKRFDIFTPSNSFRSEGIGVITSHLEVLQPSLSTPILLDEEDEDSICPDTIFLEDDPPQPNSALVPLHDHIDSSSDHSTGQNNSSNPYETQEFQFEVPYGVRFGTLADKFHDVLVQYDRDICAIPLTSDCGLNPFRVRQESSRGSQFLLHAILATSFYHLTRHSNDDTSTALMERHRSTAFHLYSEALGDQSFKDQGISFLDTALILMCLDSAQSATGTYKVHLEGVRSIIETAGGPELLIPRLPKLRAQLAMFIWYDTTIAMVSRDWPTLPISYLEGILRHGRADGWNYFNLTGCREEFVITMIKLARLASQNEKAHEMEWLHFDNSPVDEVEEVLREQESFLPSYSDSDEEETLNMEKDCYHCDEAWRCALLLYIARVFRWKREGPAPGIVGYLSRVIIDHVRSIRQSEDSPIQKQLLLPIFLAGAEVRSQNDRDFVRGYCEYWNRACGFKMFGDVISILGDVWTELDVPSIPNFWWATVTEQRKQRSQGPLVPQILLG